MAEVIARNSGKAILIDAGGVLSLDSLPVAAAEWAIRLGITQGALLGAVFGGSDDGVLIGRVSEPQWWNVVAGRLQIGPDLLAELRGDLASGHSWDEDLVTYLRRLHGRVATVIVSNAWPGMRARMSAAGLLDIVDDVVLSCEIGYAKPDPRIYSAALRRAKASPRDALFIDDAVSHVAAAESLGIAGHIHTGTADTIARIGHFLQPRC